MNQPSDRGDAFVGLKLPRGIEILERIGRGAMASVYRGVQHPLGRSVAVKILAPSGEDPAQTSERALREASLAAKLNHPNSVDIYDYGSTERGLTYLVMEFLRGQDLATVLFNRRSFPAERALALVLQVLSALEEAHTLGIVHRDVKPENIFLEQRRHLGDFVKLVDFGLARFIAPTGPQITAPHLVSGTPEYMAPEQARCEAVDGRADLYSVAVILFQLLSGVRPFESDSPTDVMLMQIGKPPPIEVLAADGVHPSALVDIVAKGLEKRPEQRFQTAREMSAALEAVLKQRQSLRPGPSRACRACGAGELKGNFCGVCGAALTSVSPPNATTRRAVPALVGRARERDWVREQRAGAAGQTLVVAELLGRAGVGKTALLDAVAEELRGAGDHVVMTGPGVFGGSVSGSAFCEILSQLPGGVVPPDLANSDAARVEALRVALTLAVRGLPRGRLVLLLDDFHLVDALSRRALLGVLDNPPDISLLLLATSQVRTLRARGGVQVQEIAPLSRERARQLASEEALGLWPQAVNFMPLELKHLDAFVAEGGGLAPPSLHDLVAQRVTRTDPMAKRVLQLLAVTGCPVPRALLIRDEADDAAFAIERLERRGLLRSLREGLIIAHPLIAEVVRSTVPAGMRRSREAQALGILTELGAPLEARAWAARRAEAVELGIVLLEQAASRAGAAGDPAAAAAAYRAVIELCRSDLGQGELSDPLDVEARFVLRWASALRELGQDADANAVLAETLSRLPTDRGGAVRAALQVAATLPARNASRVA